MLKKYAIIMGVLLIIGAGLIFIGRKPIDGLHDFFQEQDVQNGDTKQWKNYEDSSVGIKFQYPADAKIKAIPPEPPKGQWQLQIIPVDNIKKQNGSQPKAIFSMALFDSDELPKDWASRHFGQENEVVESRSYDKDRTRIFYMKIKTNQAVHHYIFSRNGKILDISFQGGDTEYFESFEKLVYSLEFNPVPDKYDYTGWNTYQDDKFGYKLKYPPDWKIQIADDTDFIDGDSQYISEIETGKQIRLYRIQTVERPINWYHKTILSTAKADSVGGRQFTINGNAAYYIKNTQENRAIKHDFVVADGENLVYFSLEEDYIPVNQDPIQTGQSSWEGLFHHYKGIVSSIEFIARNENFNYQGWKSYKDPKYNFSLKYPSDWEIRQTGATAFEGEWMSFYSESDPDMYFSMNRSKSNDDPQEWFEKKSLSIKEDVAEQERTTINGIPAYYMKQISSADSSGSKINIKHYYAISNKGNMLLFIFNEKDWQRKPEEIDSTEIDRTFLLKDFKRVVESVEHSAQ